MGYYGVLYIGHLQGQQTQVPYVGSLCRQPTWVADTVTGWDPTSEDLEYWKFGIIGYGHFQEHQAQVAYVGTWCSLPGYKTVRGWDPTMEVKNR